MNRVVRRLAWRDIKTHKAMSLAAVLLIALPVALMLFLVSMWQTSSKMMNLGVGEQARVEELSTEAVRQTPDASARFFPGQEAADGDALAIETISSIVAPNTVSLAIQDDGWIMIQKTEESVPLSGTTVASVSEDAFLEGGAPGTGEIALSKPAATALGVSVGDSLNIVEEDCPVNSECTTKLTPVRLSGITATTWVYGEKAKPVDEMTFNELASMGWVTGSISGDAPVTWEQVKKLNSYGVTVYSSYVNEFPPSEAEVDAYMGGEGNVGGNLDTVSFVATASLIILGAMEVLLVITPSFTIAAKRNEKNLAQIAAVGGTPAHLRGVMLTQGAILGLIGGLLGLAAGFGVLAIYNALVAYPLTLPWWLPILAFLVGIGLGILAALWPARKAGRTDVVAVLNNKQGGRVPSRRTAVIAPLIALACALGVFYWQGRSEVSIILVLIGLIALALSAPLFVRVGAWLVGRLNFPFRLGGRDVVRNMHRTGPAVAAITIVVAVATIAGTFAATSLASSFNGKGVFGDKGQAILSLQSQGAGGDPRESIDLAIDELNEIHPIHEVTYLSTLDPWAEGSPELTVAPEDECYEWDGSDLRCTWNTGQVGMWTWSYVGLDGLVLDDADLLDMIPEAQRAASQKILDAGGILTTNPYAVRDGKAKIEVVEWDEMGNTETLRSVEVPALASLPAGTQAPGVVYSSGAAAALDIPVVVSSALVTGETPFDIWDTRELAYWLSQDNIAALSQINAPNFNETSTALATLGVCLGVVLATSILVVLLGSRAARADLDTIDAIGAKPHLRRKFSAAVAFIITAAASLPGWVVGLYGSYLLFGGIKATHSASTLAIPLIIIVIVTIIAYVFPPKTLGMTRRMD